VRAHGGGIEPGKSALEDRFSRVELPELVMGCGKTEQGGRCLRMIYPQQVLLYLEGLLEQLRRFGVAAARPQLPGEVGLGARQYRIRPLDSGLADVQ